MQDDYYNMDDLFREASKNYPLKKPADSWDEIVPLLKSAATGKALAKRNNSIKRYNYLLILLIMVLIFSALATKDGPNLWPPGRYPDKKNEKLTGNEKIYNIPPMGISSMNQKKAKQELLHADAAISIPGYYKHVNDTGIRLKSKGNLSVQNSIVSQPDTTGDFRPEALPPDFTESSLLVTRRNIPGQNILMKRQRGIYFGFVAGPSFNQVKNQGLNKNGYDIGLIAGYQLNRKLSVESGLLFEKKYYFSDGKYFDMSKAGSGMPAGMQVLSLEGSCAIFEIPVKLKYDLAGNNHMRFFATTGISTYIVKNEYNKYRALISGTQQDITGNYNNTSKYFAAAVHLSAGYQRKIGKSVNLRIEPYLQIPLRGLGVGSLPILSTGIHMGITIPVIR